MERIHNNPADPLPEESQEKNNSDQPGEDVLQRRRHKRVKVRRRIRVKKRTKPKRKAQKTMETVAWILIITAFLMTLVILIMQLDLNDKKVKKGAPVTMILKIKTVNKLITSPHLNLIVEQTFLI